MESTVREERRRRNTATKKMKDKAWEDEEENDNKERGLEMNTSAKRETNTEDLIEA